MTAGPGAIGAPSTSYLNYPATTDSPDPTADAETYDLNRDGVITPAEVFRRNYAEAFDTASLLPPSLPFVDKTGPSLLHLDEGWTPQGQGYDAERHEILTTYYTDSNGNDKGDTVRLSVQDRYTGVEARDVVLLGLQPDGSDRPAHGGGVATYGEFVLVADTREIYVYRRDAIDNPIWNPDTGRYEVRAEHAFPMPDVPQEYRDQVVPNGGEDGDDYQSPASYLAVHGDTLYVGSYSPNDDHLSGGVFRFELDAETGAISDPTGFIKAPDQAQGLAVVDDGRGLLFSSGHESNKLVYQPLAGGASFEADPSARVVLDEGERIDSYVQGINIIDGELWVTYESGAEQYDGEDGPQSIQRIPLEALGDLPFET